MVVAPRNPRAGDRVLRNEDDQLLRGAGLYRDDLRMGQLFCAFVRATVAAAEILSIDASAALASSGLVGVFTAADLDLAPLVGYAGGPLAAVFDRPPLADGRVRFVG